MKIKPKKTKTKTKNENSKIEKMKKISFGKRPHTHGSWVPNLIKKLFYSKRKKTQNYDGPSVPNLIFSYQALHITK